jgi:hypothetical protein
MAICDTATIPATTPSSSHREPSHRSGVVSTRCRQELDQRAERRR